MTREEISMKDNDIANMSQGTKNKKRRLLSTSFGEECQILVLEKNWEIAIL